MSDELDGTRWRVAGPMPLVDGTEAVLHFDDGQVSGTAGCNRLRGQYQCGASSFSVDGVVTTMMACAPEVMALEADVLQRLGAATAAEVGDGTLVLLDEDGDVLLTLTAQAAATLQGDWTVIALHWPAREAVISADGTLTLSFTDDGDTQRVAGHGGVNSFRGSYTLDGTTLGFGPLLTTRMGGDEAAMAQEHALLAALADTASYRLEGDRLTLERDGGLISVTLHRAR